MSIISVSISMCQSAFIYVSITLYISVSWIFFLQIHNSSIFVSITLHMSIYVFFLINFHIYIHVLPVSLFISITSWICIFMLILFVIYIGDHFIFFLSLNSFPFLSPHFFFHISFFVLCFRFFLFFISYVDSYVFI